MAATQHGMIRETLTTFADTSTVQSMAPTTDDVGLASMKLIDAIGNARTFDSRLVAYERLVRQLLPVETRGVGPLERLAAIMPLDRAVIACRADARHALQLCIDEAKAAGATWDAFRPILRQGANVIGTTHRVWAERNPELARVTYPESRMTVSRPTEMSLDTALARVERAELAASTHERMCEVVRDEMWRQADVALASKHGYDDLAEATGFAVGTIHKGHANWAAANHRTARSTPRRYDDRRAETMEALRGWAKENNGSLPTGLKMWNDVPVGKKIRDFRLKFRNNRLDPEINAGLCRLFGDDWASPCPPGSPQWVERMVAGRYPDT